MTDEVFRIVITAGVAVGCLAVVIQAAVAVGLYRALREIHQKVTPLVEGSLHRAAPLIDRIGPIVDQIGPVIEKIGPALDKIGPAMEKVGPVVERMGPVVEQAGRILGNTNQMLTETRPRIVKLSDEMVGIAKSGREQVERVGELLRNASSRAETRLDQIDRTVEQTVEQVEQVGDVVKRAVMTPVREVNGIAAGISAAMATLVHRPRRPQVDEVTQDEELFI
jgi:phage-related minor tail protein